jgi:uncharacterized protein (DUF362 family)
MAEIKPEKVSRREAIKKLAAMGVAAATGMASHVILPGRAIAEKTARPGRAYGKVFQLRSPGLLGNAGDVDSDRAFSLLDRALRGLTGASTSQAAWRSLFRPDDVVGIKLNCLGGKPLSSHPGLVMALVRGLSLAGIPSKHVIVWDRSDWDLESAGFSIRTSGGPYLCYGTNRPGYEDEPRILGSIGSCFSNILNQVSALINVPVLKDHDLAGVSIGMKNFYGAIHNPNKYHDSQCNPYIADLNRHPLIDGKLRLIVCDAALVVFHGGPSFSRRWSWKMDGILAATDPVALDRVGMEIIEKERIRAGLPSLKESGREPRWIDTASTAGLGEGRLSQIQVFNE